MAAEAGTRAGEGTQASLAGGSNGDKPEKDDSPSRSTSRRRTTRITDARFGRRPPPVDGSRTPPNPTLQKQKDYLHLIKAAGVRGAWREVATLVREMGGKGVKGNVYIYNTAIAAFARCGRPVEAEALLTTMLSRDVAPDTISYNSAINGYARRGDLDAARRLLQRMTELRSMGGLVKPDQFTYNSVANAAAKRGDAVAAAEILKVMTQAGVAPSLITYNSCLAACKARGDLRRAVVLLELMREDGISPDQRSYSAAIATAGMYVRGSVCTYLVMALFCVCVVVLDLAGNVVLGCACAFCRRQLDLYFACAHPQQTNPLLPGTPIGRRGQWREVGEFLDSMRQDGLTPDKVTFNTAIAAVASSGQCQMAFSLLAEIERGGLKPDQVSCCTSKYAAISKR